MPPWVVRQVRSTCSGSAANDTVFNDLVTVAHLQTGTTGTTVFNTPNVMTTGPSSMVFGNDVVVSVASFTFDSTNDGVLSTGANITFNKTLSSDSAGLSDVVMQAGSDGVVSLLGAVGEDASGNNRALKSLHVTAGGGIVIGGGLVQTTGAQTYDNPIELSSSVTFTADSLTWGSVTATSPNVNLTLSTQSDQVLTNIAITGNLDVTTGIGNQVGGVSQAANTSLQIGGTSTFTAHTKTGQTAVLNNEGNEFAQALSFLTSNGGSWNLVDVKSEVALTMGTTTVDGSIQLETSTGDISQTGPMTISGTSNFKAVTGSILLNHEDNVFEDSVSVETPQSFKISATGALSMDQVKVGQDAEINSTGILDLGKGMYAGKLKVNSGGFDIKQSGAITFGSDVDLDAGSAKIELMSPLNMWKGALVFKGGVIIINHPSLMNAVNAGILIVRANTTLGASGTGAAAGNGSSSLQFAEPVSKSGPAISVSVDKPATANQSGMITVAVSPETAAPGRSFSFEIDPKVVSNQPAASSALKVSQVDGKPLPEWLSYEPESKTFVAKDVPTGAFPLQLKVTSGGQETVMVIREQDAR